LGKVSLHFHPLRHLGVGVHLQILGVGIGGIIGSLLRYYISTIPIGTSYDFPIHTLFVNLIGSYILGLLTGVNKRSKRIPEYLHISISTGLIGSFTTFSTFSYEVVNLIQTEQYIYAVTYLLISLIGGLLLTALGYRNGACIGKNVVKT
jgi:fluoride exporter